MELSRVFDSLSGEIFDDPKVFVRVFWQVQAFHRLLVYQIY